MPTLCVESWNGRKLFSIEMFKPQSTIVVKHYIAQIEISDAEASYPMSALEKIYNAGGFAERLQK